MTEKILFPTEENNYSCTIEPVAHWACVVDFHKKVIKLLLKVKLYKNNPKDSYGQKCKPKKSTFQCTLHLFRIPVLVFVFIKDYQGSDYFGYSVVRFLVVYRGRSFSQKMSQLTSLS
jgi:hypothetical protein